MNVLYYLSSITFFVIAFFCAARAEESIPNFDEPNNINDDEDEEVGMVEEVMRINLLGDMFGHLNAYEIVAIMGEDDWEDLEAIRMMFGGRKRKHKFTRERMVWADHVRMCNHETNGWTRRYRMVENHFNYLLRAVEDAITVDYLRSSNSTQGNDPVYPELILAMGLRFCALGSTAVDLADTFGVSIPSVHRYIDMFLDAIDYNTSCDELQVKLPDASDHNALRELAQKWSDVSTADLFQYNLGCLDGWLPRTEKPKDVPNQTDYFSGHYQCYGLNVQAMCDPDLLFLYVAVAAPGKVNDIRAFGRCTDLLEWLEALPPQYYILTDNAYPLSDRVLIPFSGTEFWIEANRTYNFYLSQMRIRIEMAFGRLTTKWRICRKTLNFANDKNAQIISVCTKLHNFCIRMNQRDEGGVRIESVDGDDVNPRSYDIDPLDGAGGGSGRMGFLPSSEEDTESPPEGTFVSSLIPDNSRRNALVADVATRHLQQPQYNVERNRDMFEEFEEL